MKRLTGYDYQRCKKASAEAATTWLQSPFYALFSGIFGGLFFGYGMWIFMLQPAGKSAYVAVLMGLAFGLAMGAYIYIAYVKFRLIDKVNTFIAKTKS
jgi:hypothetical protein